MAYWMTSRSSSRANSCSNSCSLTTRILYKLLVNKKSEDFFHQLGEIQRTLRLLFEMTRLVQFNSANVNTAIPQQVFFCVTQIFFCSTQKYVFLNIRKNPQ